VPTEEPLESLPPFSGLAGLLQATANKPHSSSSTIQVGILFTHGFGTNFGRKKIFSEMRFFSSFSNKKMSDFER
jgi:hypothetical protein